MSETFVITFDVASGQRERFRALLDPVLDAMRHEDTFVRASLHVDPDNPDLFQLHETWQDHDDIVNVQLHRPYRAEWHAALPELLNRPRDIQIWKPVRSDP